MQKRYLDFLKSEEMDMMKQRMQKRLSNLQQLLMICEEGETMEIVWKMRGIEAQMSWIKSETMKFEKEVKKSE